MPTGGNFDGDLGSFAALEVIQAVQAAKIQTRHPLEMVVWAHEESTAFGIGTAASRIVAGDLQAGDMDKVWNGMKRGDAIKRIAGNPEQIETAIRGKGAWHVVRRAPHRAGRHARQGQGADRHRRRHRRDSSLRRRHRGHRQSRRHDADERAARCDGGGRAS